MSRHVPPPLSQILSILRNSQGWSQADLADAAGIPPNLVSDYERGLYKTLSRSKLEELIAWMGTAPAAIDILLDALQAVRTLSVEPGAPANPQRSRIESLAAECGRATSDLFRTFLMRGVHESRAADERAKAPNLWSRLKRHPAPRRRLLVEKSLEFRSWALCELICKESTDAAPDSADRALELANLALRVAELLPGDEAFRSRLQGYAWAHVGNARRVRSDLPGADEAFGRVRQLWKAGEPGDPGCLLDEARMLGLEASLRRAQRRFPKALELLDKAMQIDRGDVTKHLLLSKAKILEELGEFKAAVAVLQRATPLIEQAGEPRLLLVLRFNLAVNLCFLERHGEAELLFPGLRELVTQLGNDLDMVRFRWLEARTGAGLGRRDEALVGLSCVRDEFASREIAYDAALVSLELASLYLEEEQTAEVRTLARQMLWIFHAQGVHREALAALRIFYEAAERETVTLDLTRRLVVYLHRAQNDPSLRFEDVA